MEVKKAVLTDVHKRNSSGSLKKGGFLRVKVLERLGQRLFLVEFKGKNYQARLDGTFYSRLFIAKIQKLSPRVELKFIMALDSKKSSINIRYLENLLTVKKSFIQKLIVTDNFFENSIVLITGNKKDIKESLRKSISRQNILNLMSRNKEIAEYFILQNLYNFINSQSYYFLLPILIGRRKLWGELKLHGGKETLNNGFLLKIHLENERKITFLVFIDYEIINCLISTNSSYIENILKGSIGALINNLKSLNYNRKIQIQFVPYNDGDFEHLGSLKKIDIKM